MIPTYASFRSKPTSASFSAVAITGTAPSATRNIRISYFNRAGRSLLSDSVAVNSTGVRVVLNAGEIEDGEEVFWIGISAETTGSDTDAGIIYLWQAREPDQITPRSLPVTIDFVTEEDLTINKSIALAADLPTLTTALTGAIVLAIDNNIYYRFDPESYTGAEGKFLSYGAISANVGQWIEYPFTHNAFVLDIAGEESSDRRLNTVAQTLKVPPKIGATDGVYLRYWLNNGLLDDGGSPIVEGKFTFDIDIDGIDYSGAFADKVAFTLIGYVDRDTGILDSSMLEVGVEKLWNPASNLIRLPIDLPRNHAAVYDVRLKFDNDDLVGILPSQCVELELDIVEVLNIVARVSDFAQVIGDLVLSEYCKFLVVPGLKRLGGVATFAAGFVAEDPNDQPIPGIIADTANQEVTISGNLNGLADLKQPGETYGSTEILRAVVSTEPGISRLSADAPITLSSEQITVAIAHPLSADGAGIIRSDYPDIYLRGLDKAEFTPTRVCIFLDDGTTIYQVPTQTISAIATESFTFDLSDLGIIPELPVQADPEFGLFEPASFVVTSGGAGSLTGTFTPYVAYCYESLNYQATKINHSVAGAIPTLNSTLAEAINNSLLKSQNLGDLLDVVLARTNLSVYSIAEVDAFWAAHDIDYQVLLDGFADLLQDFTDHAADTNNPHQVTAAQVGAALTADLEDLEDNLSTGAYSDTGEKPDTIPLLAANDNTLPTTTVANRSELGVLPALPAKWILEETGNFVATPNVITHVDTTGLRVVALIPNDIQPGDCFWFVDRAGSDPDNPTGFGLNHLELQYNSIKFQGYEEDLIIDTENSVVRLQFDGVDNLVIIGGGA